MDLGTLIENLDIDKFRMPNVWPFTPVEITSSGITGKYSKKDGKVYGIVKISWRFKVVGQRKTYVDAMFLLVEPNGFYHSVEKGRIMELVTNSHDEMILDMRYGITD